LPGTSQENARGASFGGAQARGEDGGGERG